MGSEHRIPLGETAWFVWRDALLRTTGFPAAGLDRLAGPRCAAVADAYLDGGATLEEFRSVFADTAIECSTELNRIATEGPLLEAITWQNPVVLTMLDSLRRSGPPEPRNRRRRYREIQLTRYWQRYCAKTETIGFFGPSLWITLSRDIERVRAVPGTGLLACRRVFLEPWALFTYGAVIAEDPAIRRWLPPTPMPHYFLAGRRLHRPGLPPTVLRAEEAAALALCNGRRPAAAVVADPTLPVREEADGFRLLADLLDRRLLRWDANLRLGPHTGSDLRDRIAAIGDEELRGRAQAGLDQLTKANDAVAAAAGDPPALAAAMAALETVFVDVTGREPRRRPGQTYAGRGLCYEDTTRALEVVVGRRFLDGIAPALSIVAQVARWLTAEVARVYEDALHRLVADMLDNGAQATLGDMWDRAYRLFWGDGERPVDRVLEALASRWTSLFGLPAGSPAHRLSYPSDTLLGRLPHLFPAGRPGWSLARIHSPDIHVCASSVEAINEGDYLAVLGETHVAAATLCDRNFTWSRAEPGRNLELAIQDFGQCRIVPLLRPLVSKDAGRTVQIEDAPTDRYLGVGKASGVDTDRLIPMSAVTVSVADGRLVGAVPDGSSYPLLEFFAHFLSLLVVNAFRSVSSAEHTPRITVDRLVLGRETWRMCTADLDDLVRARGEAEQYLAARRMVARLQLPDRCFAKLATETKPVYVDFTSPMYIACLRAMLRTAQKSGGPATSVTITEMLPTPEQTWVPDREGRTYFGEIRLQLVDPELASTVG